MSRSWPNRVLRTTLMGCLLLTQVQLLWIAAFHWNEETLPSFSCELAVRGGNGKAAPSAQTKTPCVVCQIVRQNAIWPGIGPLPPKRSSTFLFRLPAHTIGIRSYQPSVANGRAPPLS